jgi:hypothetical protein
VSKLRQARNRPSLVFFNFSWKRDFWKAATLKAFHALDLALERVVERGTRLCVFLFPFASFAFELLLSLFFDCHVPWLIPRKGQDGKQTHTLSRLNFGLKASECG